MNELGNWLRDLSSYSRLLVNKVIAPRLGFGVDYTEPSHSTGGLDLVDLLHPQRMSLKVAELISETDSTKTIRFKRLDGPVPPFRAGQYINLFVDINGINTSRPYSISSKPGVDYLDLTVKRKESGFVSRYLYDAAAEGAIYSSTGPAGWFYHEPLIDGDSLVFIAGGSGITPFMSIIREQVERKWPLTIHLFYGCQRENDVIFQEELRQVAATYDRFTYTLVISEAPPHYAGKTGFIDRHLLGRYSCHQSNRKFFICGPDKMYDFCLAELDALGVPRHRIKREFYGPPGDISQYPGWPDRVQATDRFMLTIAGQKTIEVTAGEPLLNSLEKHGIVVPTICRSGECSACRIKLVNGNVFIPEGAGIREADRWCSYIHACVSYPISNLTIRL